MLNYMVAALPTLLTPEEVAEYLRISTLTVYRALRDDEIEHAQIRGLYRITEDAVAAYLEKRTTRAPARNPGRGARHAGRRARASF
jgi:excisionase family DNA binding protein